MTRYGALVSRRRRGEPSAYLLGEREFFGRSFMVDKRVLIPRPETEHLVETALEHVRPGINTLDLGTGSGCIGLTLALESRHGSRGSRQQPALHVTCSDRSLAALAVARTNRRRFALERDVGLLCADLGGGLDLESFELIVSNPPYVDPDDPALDPNVRRFEPDSALFPVGAFAGATTSHHRTDLIFYRRLLGSTTRLAPGTVVILEIGQGQGDAVVDLAGARFELLSRRADYAGIERVLVFVRGRGS